jgi:hypothetical protein
MTKTLTPEDIRTLLTGFAAAIELDQLRVDTLAPEKFHPEYDDNLWRAWRRDHLAHIDKLIATVDAIPQAMLQELTRVAITYEPAIVEQIAVELFAERASGSCPEELETATLFFSWLIKGLNDSSDAKSTDRDAKASMLQWLAVTDPLRIGKDPECGYSQLAGFVS